MLAAVHLDLVVETELKPYDIAALIPIITGAGGVVTTWEGKPAQNGGRIVAAGDPRIHEAALKLLNGTEAVHENPVRVNDRPVFASLRYIGDGGGFSGASDPAHRALPGRRAERHHRARARTAHVGDHQAAGHHR